MLRQIALLFCLSLPAFALQSAAGWCEQGNFSVVTGGVSSTTKVQRSFPSCTVTVYDAGTVNLSTIYSDDGVTPLANPFSANANGYWYYYAANGTYSTRLSGAGIPSPLTLATVLLNDPGISNVAANRVYAGPASGAAAQPTFRSAVAADLPTITLAGDANGNTAAVVNVKVNGVAYPASPTVHQTPVITATNVATYKTLPDCFGAGQALNFTQSTDLFSCGTTAPNFSAILAGTSTAALVVGNGGSLTRTGSGIIDANKILGATLTGINTVVKMTAGVPSAAVAGTDYVDPTAATTYTAGAKQTFIQSGTTAGANLGTLSINPSGPAQGDVWYNNGIIRYRDAAANRSLMNTDTVQALSTFYRSALCDNVTATPLWSQPTTNAPTPTCSGTSYRFAALSFSNSANESASFSTTLPAGWTGAIDIAINAYVNNTTQSLKMTIQTVCIAANEDVLNPTFNAAQTVTVTSPGTANQLFQFTQTGVTSTGCAAGELLVLLLARDVTDTSTAALLVTGLNLTLRQTVTP